MMGNVSSNFADLVIIGKRVEMGVRKVHQCNGYDNSNHVGKRVYKPGQGLGKNSEGTVQPIQLLRNPGRQGLGFKPNFKRTTKELRVKSLETNKSLYETFVNREFVNQMEENTKDREGNSSNDFVRPHDLQKDDN
ncbi:hypothetical protein CR513_26259, partial [Mucuna pruriens]